MAVYGLFDIECGLRVAAENTVRVLESCGQQLLLQSIQPDGSITSSGNVLSPQVNLFHTNPDWLLRMFAHADPRALALKHRLNVAVPFWELDELPTAWLPLLSEHGPAAGSHAVHRRGHPGVAARTYRSSRFRRRRFCPRESVPSALDSASRRTPSLSR